MASFLDTGLLSLFSAVFTFLLIYAVSWGVLSTTKIFGDNKGLYAIISIVFAFFFTLSPPARAFIETVVPWYLALAVVFLMIVIAISIFAEVKWIDVVKYPTTRTWLVILVGGIFVGGLAFTFGQAALEAQTGVQQQPVAPPTGNGTGGGYGYNGGNSQVGSGSFQANLVNTLVHPKVLGLLLIFILGSLIVYFLSMPAGGLH